MKIAKSYNYKKLKLKILEKYDSQKNFAKILGKNEGYVTRYLTGNTAFTQDIINDWCEILEISACEIGDYFFCLNS